MRRGSSASPDGPFCERKKGRSGSVEIFLAKLGTVTHSKSRLELDSSVGGEGRVSDPDEINERRDDEPKMTNFEFLSSDLESMRSWR